LARLAAARAPLLRLAAARALPVPELCMMGFLFGGDRLARSARRQGATA
jgi:hypothetical protein